MGKLSAIFIKWCKRFRESESILLIFNLSSSNNNFDKFVNSTDKSNTIIVYCYHGNSSQKAAQLLINFGFLNVYSLNGGYEEWKTKLESI